jgi:hypothetical protein
VAVWVTHWRARRRHQAPWRCCHWGVPTRSSLPSGWPAFWDGSPTRWNKRPCLAALYSALSSLAVVRSHKAHFGRQSKLWTPDTGIQSSLWTAKTCFLILNITLRDAERNKR